MADDSILIQIQLGSPTKANINAVTKQIRSALSNVSANVQIQNGRQATKTLQDIKSKTDAATKSTASFAEAIGLSARRFVAFTSAVAVVGRLTSALSQATREAIKFEREFVKLSQVFDTDVRSLGNLQNSLSDLSREFGLSATVIAKTSVVLAQSGLTAKQTEDAMKTLAKTTLAATFDSIASSTEGAVAIMAQFGTEASKLEAQLGAINAVSKKFAVESGDIIEAVRRSGGAFRAAGGTLNEFIALFTSVRSTTRESAETIATGFRTIFARLQRPKTIEYFRELNIELTDGKGNFIGAFEAVRRLSKGLEEAGIKAGSIKFAGVVEQLGGIRQVSRVIPLLQQFTKAELARQVAIGGAGSLDKDAAKAQATLAQSFARTTENFRALIREISQTGTFQAIVKIALDLANAFIEVARSLKPLIPLIAAFGAIKFGGLLSGAVRSGVGGSGGTGGLGKGFKRGGPVPGTGSGDTVPAMLEPGEFVIRKSAVQAFGADRLAGINKYANAGKAKKDVKKSTGIAPRKELKGSNIDGEFNWGNIEQKKISSSGKGSIRGYLWEDYLSRKFGTKAADDAFPDIKPNTSGMGKARATGGGTFNNVKAIELKYLKGADYTQKQLNKWNSDINNKTKLSRSTVGVITTDQTKQKRRRKAAGGSISGAGTDTVPALLTPGEFVINKESAKSFGYGKLGKINKYAKGGVVQKFAGGGDVGEGGGGFGKLTTVLFILPQLLSTFAESIGGANSEIGKFLKAFGNAFLTIVIIAAGFKQLKKGLSDFIGSIGKKARIVKATDEASKEIRDGGDKASSSIREAGKKVEKSLEEVSKLAKAFESARQRISETGATKTAAKKEETKLRGNLTRAKDNAVPGASNKFIREAEEALAEAVTKRVKIEKDILRKQKLNAAKKDVLATKEFTNQEDLNKEIKRRADAQKFVAENIKQSEPEGTPKAKGGFGRRARGVVQGARRKFRGTKVGRTLDVAARKGQAGLNKLKAGKLGKVLGKLPGVVKVAAVALKALNVAALAVTAGFIASFKVAGEKATKASEEAIQDGKVQDAQLQALRASSAEKAAKDLTVASGFVQGLLGPFAGLAQPLLIVASATGVLGEAFDKGTRVFNDFIKGIVNFLDSFGLVDPEIKQQIFEGLIDPQVKRELDAFSAGLKAATRNLEKQGEQIKEDIELSKNRLANIRDQGDREKELAGTFETISNRVSDSRAERQITRPGAGGVGLVTTDQAVGKAAFDKFEKILEESSPERKKDAAAITAQNKNLFFQKRYGAAFEPKGGFKGELKDVPKTREVSSDRITAIGLELKQIQENTNKLKGNNDEQLSYLGFLKQQSQSVQELSTVLGLASSESLKFVKTKKGEVLLSFQTIEASKPLSKLYNSLVIELGDEKAARSAISAAMSDETKLREANNATLAAQQKAFSNLLQKFTFGSDESRQEIGQDINSVKKLVAADFDIDSPQIASEERSKILSFLQSVPGATFQGKDGKVVQSEDIVVNTILKKFDKFGLEQTNLLGTKGQQEAQEEADRKIKANQDAALGSFGGVQPLDEAQKANVLAEEQNKIIRRNITDQLFPQKAQLDELRAQTKLLEELRNQAKVEGSGGVLTEENAALAKKNAQKRIEALPAIGSNKEKREKAVQKKLEQRPRVGETQTTYREEDKFHATPIQSGRTSITGLEEVIADEIKARETLTAQILKEEQDKLRTQPGQGTILRPEDEALAQKNADAKIKAQEKISIRYHSGPLSEERKNEVLTNEQNELKLTPEGVSKKNLEDQRKEEFGDIGAQTNELIKNENRLAVEQEAAEQKRHEEDLKRRDEFNMDALGAFYSKGGPIYASQGTLVNMQPQGTDTVPAMLTPGEFVINAQSASRLGLGTLNQLNGYAKGGPVKYLGRGGGSTEDEEERLRARQARQSDFSERVREVEGVMDTNAFIARRKNENRTRRSARGLRDYDYNTLGELNTDSKFNTPVARKLSASRARKKAARESFKERKQTKAAEERERNLETAREQNRESLAARRERSADSIGETVQRKGLSYANTPAGIQRSINFYNESPNQPPVMSEQMRRDLAPRNVLRPTAPAPTPTPPPIDPDKNRLNKGGLVRGPQYLSRGGAAAGGGGGIDTSGLASFASDFGSSVSDLVGSAITLEVAPMGININLNGAELLAQLPQMVQRMVIGEIQSELGRFEQTRDFNNTPGAYASSILA